MTSKNRFNNRWFKEVKYCFQKNGTVTPGNSSGINDGAAGVIITTKKIAESKNLEILGKIVSWSSVGVDPSLMGLGPIDAIRIALKKLIGKLKMLICLK